MQRLVGREDPGSIPDIASRVIGGIAIKNFIIFRKLRHADPIVIPYNRCKVAANYQKIIRISPAAKITDRAVLVIVAVNPLESLRLEIHLIKCRFTPVNSI